MQSRKQSYLITYDAEAREPTKVEWLGGAGELRRVSLDAVTFRIDDTSHAVPREAEQSVAVSPDHPPRPDAIPIGARAAPRPDAIPIGAKMLTRIGESSPA